MINSEIYVNNDSLANKSFAEFAQCIRLKRTTFLLLKKSGNFTEIAYQTGFSNFSRTFKEQFGVRPSEYTIKVNNLIKK